MDARERFFNALTGKPKDRTPLTCVTQLALVESMEAFNAKWPEAHKDPEKMATLGVSLYKLVGLEVARIPFDLTVQADALGATVDMGTINIQPSVKAHPFDSADKIEIPEDFLERGRIPVVLEATKILKEKWGNTLPILAGFEGPMTLAGHLVGTEKLLIWMIKKRNEVKEILEKTTEANIIYANALLKAGADVLVPCDPTASPDMISPLDFREIAKPGLTELARSAKGYHVLHICGKTKPIIKEMAETGAHGLSIEDKVDIRYAKEAAGNKARIIGNVSTSKTIFMGTPDEVKEEAKKVLDAGVDLLAPACGLPSVAPLDNIKALVTAVREYYKL
jgi:[methyl-Co(III) methanol-specific corrinoid protein]:coenzyme M methyltransferase